jgi:NTE family protein
MNEARSAGSSAEPTPTPSSGKGRQTIVIPKALGQIVLVLQGGGALGAYQAGVYEALHEAGIEPDWIIGTSIGAINAALIAGNPRELRAERLWRFWRQAESAWPPMSALAALGLANLLPNAATVIGGIPGIFAPNPLAWGGVRAELGVDRAAYYDTAPLRESLSSLVDFDRVGGAGARLTVGAVSTTTGTMHYFDSRRQRLGIDHVMASAALPPAFPAVRVDGQAYWDGGIYSNTPIEAVLDDNPRRDSLIFAVNVWHRSGPEPGSIWEVMGRQKDIQYASRDDSHIARQKQIHRLRHVIEQLASELPAAKRSKAQVRALAAWGCRTTMHVAHLVAPRLDGEDQTKDIDFNRAGVQARREAGRADARRMIEHAPWRSPVDPLEGVIEHHLQGLEPGLATPAGATP